MAEGDLLASGRDADVYDAGPGRVLRRTRRGTSQVVQATVMTHVRAAGYPAPEVLGVSDDGSELLLARAAGPTMLEELAHRPWRLDDHARLLADLHHRLHRIPAPDGLTPGPVPGDVVVHLDLHPDNVILTSGGPTVIDWANARRGTPASDVAATWVLLACAEMPATGLVGRVQRALRKRYLRAFLAQAGREQAAESLADVVAWKLSDANVRPTEATAMRALANTAARSGGRSPS